MAVNKYPFNIAWSEEDGEFVATCPAFPGLSALGETEEEALAEAKIALGLFIKTCDERGIPLPEPQTAREYSGQTRLRISKTLHRLAAERAEEEGESLNQYLAGAIQMRVAGEQIGTRFLNEIQGVVAQQAQQNQTARQFMEQRLTHQMEQHGIKRLAPYLDIFAGQTGSATAHRLSAEVIGRQSYAGFVGFTSPHINSFGVNVAALDRNKPAPEDTIGLG